MIWVLCTVHFISMYYVRKGSWAFLTNYPQISEVGKSDYMEWRASDGSKANSPVKL